MQMIADRFGRKVEGRCASQGQVDDIVAAARLARAGTAANAEPPVKRPLFRDPPRPPLAPSTELLDRRIEEEINFVRRLLDSVGDRLVADPILLTRHQSTLQSFDIVTQLLGHIATVVGANDRAEAVNRIGMGELRARLLRPDAAAGPGSTTPVLHRTASNPFAGH